MTIPTEAATEQTPFIAAAVPETKKLNRRYTQKKTPNVTEFTAEFEQIERSRTGYDTVLSDDIEYTEYSDTARLTGNISGVSGFSPSMNTPQINPYQPASIDPLLDQRQRQWNTLVYYTRIGSFRLLSNITRNVAHRVYPLHYNNLTKSKPSVIPPPQEDIEHSQIPITPTHTNESHNRPILVDSTPKLYGNTLYLLSPTHPLRLFAYSILQWKWTEACMMLLVVVHGIVLIIVGWGDNPYPTPLSRWGQRWDQYVVLSIFCCYTLMAFIRIVVYGLFNNTVDKENKIAFKGYLRHSWDRVDAMSIITYWVHFGLLLTEQEIIGEERRILVFKMLSTLILLRLLNITDGSKVILNSLKKAAPLLVNVLVFVFFFFLIFGIIGVQSFKGSFRRHCVREDPAYENGYEELQQYCGGHINMDTNLPEPYLLASGENGLWSKGFICENGLICRETSNPYGDTISFDNIFSSILLVMIITGVQSWTDRMYDMMDSEYFFASVYFVLIVIVMNFWLINLFIAVITEMFAKVREDSQHSAFTHSTARPILADGEEEDWQFSENDITKKVVKQPSKSILSEIVKYMKPFWLLMVVADLLVMAARNNNMSAEELSRLDLVETIFSVSFFIEILIRMLPHRHQLWVFFQDKINSLDFLIAVVTCIIQIPPVREAHLVYIWFTGFQVLRIYRVVVAIPRLRSLMSRVLGNVRGLINLLFFIVLAILICAIIAYQLFEGVINEEGEEMRFFSIYNSFVALYQLFSGEDWTTVLYNVMEAGSDNHNSAIYALFLVFWFAFSNFVLINMFIAVLMENFEIAESDKRKNQVQDYMKKTEDELDKKNLVSPWNVYRYFKPKPKGLDITNIPHNLVYSVQKSIVREFMSGASDQKSEPAPLQKAQASQEVTSKVGVLDNVRNFLVKVFPGPQQSIGTSNTPRISLDRSIAFDQVGTFYDFQKRGGVQDMNEPRSLRYLVDPTLRETVANRLQETMDHDMEERRALRRDFIRNHPTYDKSLYLFSARNPLRRWCQLIVQPSRGERLTGTQASRWGDLIFATFITCCVLANVVLTIYNSPVYQLEHRDDPAAVLPFIYCDWAFTVIFSFELLVKVIADGFLWTPNAYLLNGWNLLDLFVLITLYMSNFGQFSSTTGLERAFRAFKALRALRLINLLGFAKETFTSILVVGLPRILDAAALGLCLIIPFAIYGQNIFMGLFYMCNEGDLDKPYCFGESMLEVQEPMSEGSTIYMPRIWNNPYVYSFDSFWKSLLILFEIASGEGWVDVLTSSMGITGKDKAPQQDASQLWGIFFMVYNLAGSVFVISLFLGVVIENFTKRNGSAYLTVDQRRWLDLKKLLNQIRPAKRPKVPPTNAIRKTCYDLAVEKRGMFYKCMTFVISANIIFLCTDTVNAQDDLSESKQGWSLVKVYISLGFIFIYWIEIIIKLLGLGWKYFRRNLWNLFDLTIVIGSFVSVIITLGNPSVKANVESQKLFMTALCFKLVQRNDGLNQLFTTMAASAYQIANVFAVWFVALTTYAIMFMQIFGLTRYGPSSTTEHINFRTFSNTLISLVRYSTGEAWNSMMHDFTVEYPNCVLSDNYLDSDCGSLRWAYFLFLTFNIISMYIFTAIFVAVVADNFSYVYQIKANFANINRDEIRKFKMTWASIDTDRDGYVKPKEYMTLWRKLDGELKVRIFDPEYSYKNLVKECHDRTMVDSPDIYTHHLDLNALNEKLSKLDKQQLHARRKDLEKIYWETALVESTSKGVSFNQMLLMLAQRKLIIPENALILEELLENQKKEEAIHTLSSIDRVRGLIETIVLRKKFLKHLEDKKRINRELPSIVIDNGNNITQTSHRNTVMSPMILPDSPNNIVINIPHSATSSVYDDYMSDGEEDDVNDYDDAHIMDDITEDNPAHDLWKEILQHELD